MVCNARRIKEFGFVGVERTRCHVCCECKRRKHIQRQGQTLRQRKTQREYERACEWGTQLGRETSLRCESGNGSASGGNGSRDDSNTINDGSSSNHNSAWGEHWGVPSYLRSKEYEEFCSPRGEFDFKMISDYNIDEGDEASSLSEDHIQSDGLWQVMRSQANEAVKEEMILSSFLYTSILAHSSFEKALAFVLSNRLKDATLLSTQLNEIFVSCLSEDPTIGVAARSDIVATHERDPACRTYIDALLYFKGYQSIQCMRIAHHLWCKGDYFMAQMLQSRISEVYAVDIHPAAKVLHSITSCRLISVDSIFCHKQCRFCLLFVLLEKSMNVYVCSHSMKSFVPFPTQVWLWNFARSCDWSCNWRDCDNCR